MERKTVKFEIKAIDEEKGIIEGYGSTFDPEPDSYGDIVDEGAFTATIKNNSDSIVSLAPNHNTSEPIGKPELTQDKKGLFARIQLVRGVQKAEETLLLAKAGVIRRMSIGYDTIKQETKDGIRHLKEVRLYDVSPVVFAANTNAVITAVKSKEDIIAEAKDIIKTLQALLETKDSESLSDKTSPTRQDQSDPAQVQEAADMENVLNGIEVELSRFDIQKAEARINQLLAEFKN